MGGKLNIILKKLPFAAILLLSAACKDDATMLSADNDEPVVIRATADGDGMNNGLAGRELLFTYPSKAEGGKMKSLVCTFNEEGYGVVYTDEEKTKLLRWDEIDTGRDAAAYPEGALDAVYLDNLVNYPVQTPDPSSEDILKKYDNFQAMRFGYRSSEEDKELPLLDGANPRPADYNYKWMAAPVKSEKAKEVDIIWNRISKPEKGKLLEFKLEHKMSAISFRFYSEDEDIATALQGDGITVYLDYVRPWLETKGVIGEQKDAKIIPFKRADGTFGIKGNLEIQHGLCLVKERRLEPIETAGEADRKYCSTPVWIFPPNQYAAGSSSGPEMTIILGNGNQYGGRLPQQIKYCKVDEEGKEVWIEENLNFKAGYHLTFNVKLSSATVAQPVLFERVEVADWYRMLTETSSLSESGINSWEDYVLLVELYNKGDHSEDNYRLMKYGVYNEGTGQWKFDLWRNITMPVGEVELPKFDTDDFEIEFNGYTIADSQGNVIAGTKESIVRNSKS